MKHGIGDRMNRRSLMRTSLAGGALALGVRAIPARAQTPVPRHDRLVVDLDGEVSVFDPALTYTTRGWSIVHSIYDALIDFGSDGSIVPLAAESFTTEDAITARFLKVDAVHRR